MAIRPAAANDYRGIPLLCRRYRYTYCKFYRYQPYLYLERPKRFFGYYANGNIHSYPGHGWCVQLHSDLGDVCVGTKA